MRGFCFVIITEDDGDTVERELVLHGVTRKVQMGAPNRVYTGEPFSLETPDGISMRELTFDDMDEIEAVCARLGNPWAPGIRRNLNMRDNLGGRDNPEFIFGIFREGEMIGLTRGSLDGVREFCVNNCIVTALPKEYRPDEVYRYAFKFVTNAALERGALPVDDLQYYGNERLCGGFDSEELGYRTVVNTVICK